MSATFFQELQSSARGVFGLLTGNRQAPLNFDFSQRGLVGSFIAFFIAIAVSAGLPFLLGAGGSSTPLWRQVLLLAVVYALQVGAGAIVLRQLGRLDGLIPFIVADNWANFFSSMLLIAATLVGFGTTLALIVWLAAFIIQINAARLIVTLSPMQIVTFIAARLAGAVLGMLVIAPDIIMEASNASMSLPAA